MRRVLLLAILATTVLALTTGVAFGNPKPLTYKTGTYKGAVGPQKISFAVKRARCGGKMQLCVTLSKALSSISCTGPAGEGGAAFAPLTATVALPSSGKVSEHSPVTEKIYPPPANFKETLKTGFTATFTKKGTVSGVFELDVVQIEEGGSFSCTGRERFTAKLG